MPAIQGKGAAVGHAKPRMKNSDKDLQIGASHSSRHLLDHGIITDSKKSIIPDPQNWNSKKSLMLDSQELRTPYFKEKSKNQFEGRNESRDTDLNSGEDASPKLVDKSR